MRAVLIFRRRRPLNRWRVSPSAGVSAFSGVWVFFSGIMPILAQFI